MRVVYCALLATLLVMLWVFRTIVQPVQAREMPSALETVEFPQGTTSFTGTATVADTVVFSYTGNLNKSRHGHTATLLSDGQVLIAGGEFAAFDRVELYNPTTSVFTFTGDLGEGRTQHTATVLPSGNVLIVGGLGNSGYLSSAELYNPATGTFTHTGNMNESRFMHTATLLDNGKVLIAGGYNGTDLELSSAELYDPATGMFTLTGNMHQKRRHHTATILPDGTVLIAGGDDGSAIPIALDSAELYNPSTGTFTITDDLNQGRKQHTATLLPDGTVLIAGGISATPSGFPLYLSSTELYNPATNTFTFADNMSQTRWDHIATLLSVGKVLITGGFGPGYLASTELYNPTANTFISTNDMHEGRREPTATLLSNGKVFIVGGLVDGANSPSAELGTYIHPNIFTGILTLPSGWITDGVGTVVISGTTASDPLNGGSLSNNGVEWGSWLTVTNNVPVTTTWDFGGDGVNKPVYLRLRDTIDRMATVVTGMVNVDTAKPSSSLIGLPATTTTPIQLSWFGSDNVSGIAGYDVQVRIGASGEWTPVLTGTTATTTTFDGFSGNIYYFRVRATDVAGNVELWPVPYDTFTLATNTFTGNLTLPSGWITDSVGAVVMSGTTASALLNGGALSNDGVNWGSWIAMTNTVPTTTTWDFGGDGVNKPVYLRLQDVNSENAVVANGTVNVDTTAPSSFMTDLPATSPTSILLSWSGVDNISGVSNYDVQVLRVGTMGKWTPILTATTATTATYSGISGNTYYFRVRATDVAGNVEAWPISYDTFTLATNTFTGILTLPSGWITDSVGTIVISGTTASAPLNGGALSNDGVNWGSWITMTNNVPVTTTWDFGSDGANKPVYLRLRDVNSESAVIANDTVNVDTTAPLSSMTELPATSPTPILLSWSGVDNISGVSNYDVQVRVGASGEWTSILTATTTATNVTFDGLSGNTYYFRVRATDVAGNMEAWPTSYDTFTLLTEEYNILLPLIMK